jgi:hypothetical protein
MNNLVSRAFDTLHALLIASIIGTILIGASAVFGDDSAFYWDESGKMQMSDTWSPMSPNSRRTTESDRRNYNDWVNNQTLKQNEAMIEGYYNSKPSSPPSGSSSSDYWITGADGRSQWCRSIAPRQVLCQ